MSESLITTLIQTILGGSTIAAIFAFVKGIMDHRSGKTKREREDNRAALLDIHEANLRADWERKYRISLQEALGITRGVARRHGVPEDNLPPFPEEPPHPNYSSNNKE